MTTAIYFFCHSLLTGGGDCKSRVSSSERGKCECSSYSMTINDSFCLSSVNASLCGPHRSLSMPIACLVPNHHDLGTLRVCVGNLRLEVSLLFKVS